MDADGVLSPAYVRELNNALEWDYDIYLTRKYMKNGLGDRKKRTVFSNNSALTWAMLDDLGNRYRTAKDIPLTMCGQGMMLRRSLIQKLGGWPYRTFTEDYELRLDSVLKGFKSMYWPYAVLYTEEAPGHRDNFRRRMRWLTGYIQCDEKYKSQIKAQAKERGKMTTAERDCLYGVYPLALFVAGTIFTLVAGTVLAIGYAFARETELMFRSIFFLIVMPFAIMYVLLLLYNMLAMAASPRSVRCTLQRRKSRDPCSLPPSISSNTSPSISSAFTDSRERRASPGKRANGRTTAARQKTPRTPTVRRKTPKKTAMLPFRSPRIQRKTKRTTDFPLCDKSSNPMNLCAARPKRARSALLSALFSTKELLSG